MAKGSTLREQGFLIAVYSAGAGAAVGGPDSAPGESSASQPVFENDAMLSQASSVVASLGAAKGEVRTHDVKAGDTVASLANNFKVSPQTILWANNLTAAAPLRIGQRLTILPVSGLLHKVRPGETLGAIALQYSANLDEVIAYNGLDADGFIVDGQMLIIPGGQKPAAPRYRVRQYGLTGSEMDVRGYFVRPVAGRLTQGLHAYNAVDLGAACGTAIHAAASGTVVIADASGWNGGYGRYVKLSHANGTQTLYAHMTKILAAKGDELNQGDIIGLAGSTGRSTGCHVHFEVLGAANPFATYEQ